MWPEITFSHIATPRRLHRSPCSFSCQEKNILESKYFYFSFIIEGFLFSIKLRWPSLEPTLSDQMFVYISKTKISPTVISSRCCFCCQYCCCWCWALGELSPSEYLSTCFHRLSRFLSFPVRLMKNVSKYSCCVYIYARPLSIVGDTKRLLRFNWLRTVSHRWWRYERNFEVSTPFAAEKIVLIEINCFHKLLRL